MSWCVTPIAPWQGSYLRLSAGAISSKGKETRQVQVWRVHMVLPNFKCSGKKNLVEKPKDRAFCIPWPP